MIDTIKSQIAYKARLMGFRFDESEIIDVTMHDRIIVLLRSVKNIRTIELTDGTLIDEEFNDPIVWIDYPPMGLATTRFDPDKLHIQVSMPLPKLTIKYPDLVFMSEPSPPAASQSQTAQG